MAKPIRATPTLKGKDAVRFIKKMQRVEKGQITKYQNITAIRIKHNSKGYEKLLATAISS